MSTTPHRPHPRHRHTGGRASRGFSLIELMVSIVIAMAMIVAMGIVSTRFDTGKRQAAASADLSLNTGYLAYDLDRQLRSAGSGFTTNRNDVYGCQLMASRTSAGGQILPATAAFPAPFASVPTTVRMIPLLVHPDSNTAKPDVIQVMTGAGGLSEVATEVRLNSVATSQFRLTNTVGIQGNDLMLVVENGQPCMLEQVASNFTSGGQQVTLGGDLYASSIGTRSLNAYSVSATAGAMVMGNASNGNPPRFTLLGVNASNQLVSYDLLRFANGSGNAPVVLADGVMDLRVRYGVDTNGNTGMVDAWVKPGTSPYDVATLNGSNTTAAQTAIKKILAVRVALVLRAERLEKDDAIVSPAKLTMFSSLDSALQVEYTVPQRNRKFRIVEFTVPLRNPLLAARS